jgi:hypothetical protein
MAWKEPTGALPSPIYLQKSDATGEIVNICGQSFKVVDSAAATGASTNELQFSFILQRGRTEDNWVVHAHSVLSWNSLRQISIQTCRIINYVVFCPNVRYQKIKRADILLLGFWPLFL